MDNTNLNDSPSSQEPNLTGGARNKKPLPWAKWGFILVAILFFLNSTIFVVDQREYGVIYTLGKIESVVTEPGLVFKWPSPFQNVKFLDKRLLDLSSSGTDTIRTVDKQPLQIDWFVRWRISKPASYIRNVGDDAVARNRLAQVVRNAFIAEANKLTVEELLVTRRDEIMASVARAVSTATNGQKDGKSWGVEVVDVRLTRIDYSKEVTDSVYNLMRSERIRVASEKRLTALAEGERIRAEGYKQAQVIKGQADAKTSQIYAQSFGKDPQFAEFFRSLEAYKNSFKDKGDILVVDPSGSDFFKAMRSPNAGGR